MVLAIPEALITAIEATVQTKQFDTNPAGYADIMRIIISKILACKNMSNKMESLQIQLELNGWSAVEATLMLDRVTSEMGRQRGCPPGSRLPVPGRPRI